MRIAVVSDIHGNLTALEAVLADLRYTSPDLVIHGGDLSDAGSSPVEVVDAIRDLGWPGVIGNTDEMLARPQTLADFASQSPSVQPLLPALEEMAAFTRAALGEARLDWLGSLPRTRVTDTVAVVHASPETAWRSPTPESADPDFESTYGPLAKPVVVYAHVHRGFIRPVNRMMVINTGSVNLSYDGDPRASYLLLDGVEPTLRRVEYDVGREVTALEIAGHPHWQWIAKILQSARPQMP